MSNVKQHNKQEEIVAMSVKNPESITSQSTVLVSLSAMGKLRELTPITLGRSDWFPCSNKKSLNNHLELRIST
jgi:hypothetical protein